MFTSAINTLVGQAPGYVYPKPTAESKKRNFEVYQGMEQERKERAEKRVALAVDLASEERREVAAFNANIDRQNQEQGRTGRHKLRQRKAEQVFKMHPLPNPATTKGGIIELNTVSNFYSQSFIPGSVRLCNLSFWRRPGMTLCGWWRTTRRATKSRE
jgi:hypothetical protein